jgi:quercetin dioxygenase-like cupin family protein
MQYVRLYSDDKGETHFAAVTLQLNEADYRPPAPLLHVSHAYEAGAVQFVRMPSGWVGNAIHPPKHQFLIGLKGSLEITTSDGKSRTFGPGDTVLMEDVSGKGHRSRVKGAEEFISAIIPIK